jgi:CRP-like cAMP-binding protein
MEETEVAIIPKEDFDELVNKNAEVTKKFVQLLAKNIFAKESQLLGLAYNSLRKKVADAILLLQKKYHDTKEENFVIDISRENLATIAGTATESLIRTLSDFRSEKLIDINEGRINIVNKKKLESLLN